MSTQTQDQVCIITGSNSGIGFQAALQMAQKGIRVVMMCRSQERGEAARQKIIAASGNQNVDLILADMSSPQSIRHAVDEFTGRYDRLDILINNAASFDIRMKQPQLTPEGIETIFATNHLGPFLLTNLLLERLKASAPARVLNVASKGLLAYPFLKVEFDNLNGQRKFSAQRAYYHSKLAQILFTRDLAQRLQGTGVTVNSIRVPAVRLDEGRYDHVPAFLRAIYTFKMKFSLSTEVMAQTYVRLATEPEFANLTGEYIDENCKTVKMPRNSGDEAVWKQLWERSAELTELMPQLVVG